MCVKDRNLLGIQLHGKTSESRVPTSGIQPHNTFDSPKRMHVKPPHLEGGREGGSRAPQASAARLYRMCVHTRPLPSIKYTHASSFIVK
jgi:hypothetical protein